MNETIRVNHARISATAARFLDYASTQSDCLNKQVLVDDEVPMLVKSNLIRVQSWPWFISPRTRSTLAECVRLPSLIYKAMKLEFDDAQRFADFYGVSTVLAHLFLDWRFESSAVCQRTDAILTSDGFRVTELNVGSSIGGWCSHWMDRQYRKQPALQRFFAMNECWQPSIPLGYLEAVIRTAKSRGAGDEPVNALMLVDPGFHEVGGAQLIRGIFDTALVNNNTTGSIEFAVTCDRLRARPNGLYLDDTPIAVVLSTCNQTVPSRDLYRYYFSGQLVWPDNPLDSILDDKRSLSVLYKHRNSASFSKDERRIIDSHIPWTVPLRSGTVSFRGRAVDLEALLMEQKDRFVLKVAKSLGGLGVFIGKYQSANLWDTLVRRGIREGSWVVQEYCESLQFYCQSGTRGVGLCNVVWGIFGDGEKYGGCWNRLLPTGAGEGVISGPRGAEEAIVYEAAD